MCQVLEVSTSGYYAWLEREPAAASVPNQPLAQAVTRSYLDSDRTYGYRKVWQDLQAASVACCQETIRRVMKRLGFCAQYKRRFVVTTDSNHSYAVAENVLNRDFFAEAPDRKWVADITYIPTQEGWLYLAAVLDLFSRKVVGWAASERIDEALVTAALDRAIRQRRPGPGLLHHSDRGSQYAADGYQRVLSNRGMVCSMSRKGNCWDNAVMERFFGSLKAERVHRRSYPTRAEAKKDLFMYIEWFYNAGRRHAALNYQTPNAVESQYWREYQVA